MSYCLFLFLFWYHQTFGLDMNFYQLFQDVDMINWDNLSEITLSKLILIQIVTPCILSWINKAYFISILFTFLSSIFRF